MTKIIINVVWGTFAFAVIIMVAGQYFNAKRAYDPYQSLHSGFRLIEMNAKAEDDNWGIKNYPEIDSSIKADKIVYDMVGEWYGRC